MQHWPSLPASDSITQLLRLACSGQLDWRHIRVPWRQHARCRHNPQPSPVLVWSGPCLPCLVDWSSHGADAGHHSVSYPAYLPATRGRPISQSPLGASLWQLLVHMHITVATALCTCYLDTAAAWSVDIDGLSVDSDCQDTIA